MNHTFSAYLRENRERHLHQLSEFLRIPSISALPEHKNDIRRAAKWLSNEMKTIGLEHVEIMETDGNPIVYGDWLHTEGKPTVLIYGHYDVQPVDPLDLWDSPPFEPVIKDGKLFARGASDDKGQIFMHLKALEALLATENGLPVNVRMIFEGEEEIGSPHLPAFVKKSLDLLKADCLVISDTAMLDRGKPAICYGLRGLTGIEITVKGAKADLHSGAYGGGVRNAAQALVELLASFHDSHGNVLVEGFYDDVRPLSEEERRTFRSLSGDEKEICRELGVPDLFGEPGYCYQERIAARPTLEINGIFGGFTGEGIKTIIPSKAVAKITCRLVPDQKPQKIYELLVRHVEAHKPKGVEVSYHPYDSGPPFLTPLDHPVIQAAGKAYETVYGVPVTYIRSGGSIPIVAEFQQQLKIPIVLMGFGLPNENYHAPNEHFHLENFEKGLEVLCQYWFLLSSGF
jgi:Peptidase family M20/M25/M40.